MSLIDEMRLAKRIIRVRISEETKYKKRDRYRKVNYAYIRRKEKREKKVGNIEGIVFQNDHSPGHAFGN